MFTAPDEHMPYIIQLHIMSIQPANKAAEHLIKFIMMTEAVNDYFIKNITGEGERERERKKRAEGVGVGGGGRGHSHEQSEGPAGVLWVYKIGLK